MTTSTRRRAAAAGAAAFAAGAAVAVLQLLQQTVGAFNPRPVISTTIVVGAFLAGLTAARFRAREAARTAHEARASRLRTLLGVWPASSVTDASAVRLGVFPARRDAGAEPDYVMRSIDPRLRAAIVPGAVVLVVGEPRAGASRTALHAARAAAPDGPVLAPRNPRALCDLLELDPGLRFDGETHVLVWLDSLDRFADAIDAECLDRIDHLAKRVTLIATIRAADWDRWLNANGDAGEAARAIVARAHVFVLPAALDADELARAHARHPGRDFSAGIGVAFASSGRDEDPPVPVEEHGGEDPASVPLHKDVQFVGFGLATLAAVGVLVVLWAGSGFSTRSISDQLTAVLRAGSRGGRHAVVIPPPADFLGSGGKAHVLLFVDGRGTPDAASDELRIYEERGDALKLALRFRPAGPRAVFAYRATTDVDFDGADEVVGGYGYPASRQAMVPFAIDFDQGTGRYRLVSLDLGAPRLSRPARDVPEQQYRRVYAATTTFADPEDRLAISGHRVQDFAVTPRPHRLVAGWFLEPFLNGRPARLELHAAILDASTGLPHLTPCTLSGLRGPLVVSAGQDRRLDSLFQETFTRANRPCGPAPQPTKR